MPGYESAVINVISGVSLASTSIFENMNYNNNSYGYNVESTTFSNSSSSTIDYSSSSTASLTSDRVTLPVGDNDQVRGQIGGPIKQTGLSSCGKCSSKSKDTRLEEEEEDEGYASGDESVDRDADEERITDFEGEFRDTGLLFSSEEDFITMDELNGSYFNNSYGEFDGILVDSYNNTGNASDNNETYVEGLYPSGYSLIQIIFASIAATILMIIVVVGNMLVIIAIATEKALKNIQNWFIASLAVADFFLGLLIMPFSLANEIMGYWIFGYWWCDIYSAMDVLLCTASIMNLCLISLDRYWSITQAVEYLKKRTPARAALMITLVWLMSALICIPPLLGWKRPTPEEEYPKCKVSFF